MTRILLPRYLNFKLLISKIPNYIFPRTANLGLRYRQPIQQYLQMSFRRVPLFYRIYEHEGRKEQRAFKFLLEFKMMFAYGLLHYQPSSYPRLNISFHMGGLRVASIQYTNRKRWGYEAQGPSDRPLRRRMARLGGARFCGKNFCHAYVKIRHMFAKYYQKLFGRTPTRKFYPPNVTNDELRMVIFVC